MFFLKVQEFINEYGYLFSVAFVLLAMFDAVILKKSNTKIRAIIEIVIIILLVCTTKMSPVYIWILIMYVNMFFVNFIESLGINTRIKSMLLKPFILCSNLLTIPVFAKNKFIKNTFKLNSNDHDICFINIIIWSIFIFSIMLFNIIFVVMKNITSKAIPISFTITEITMYLLLIVLKKVRVSKNERIYKKDLVKMLKIIIILQWILIYFVFIFYNYDIISKWIWIEFTEENVTALKDTITFFTICILLYDNIS